MGRPVAVVILALLIAATAVLAGSLVTNRLAPARLRVELESRLSEALGTPVRVGEVQTALRYGLVLEARNAQAWSGPEGPQLVVDRLLARFDPAALLRGELRIRWLVVEGADFVLGPDDTLSRLLDPARGADEPDAADEPLATRLDRLAEALGSLPTALEYVELHGGRLRGIRRGDHRAELAAIEGKAWQREDGTSEIHLRGGVWLDDENAGRFDGRLTPQPALRLELGLEGVSLARFGAWLDQRSLRGQSDLALTWQTQEAGVHRLRVELDGRSLAFDHRDVVRLRLPRMRLRADTEIREDVLRLLAGRLDDGSVTLTVAGSTALPLQSHAATAARLRVAGARVTSVARLARRIGGQVPNRVGEIAGHFDAGSVREAILTVEAPLGRWPQLFAPRAFSDPGHFELELSLADVRLPLASGGAVESIDAEVSWTGDSLWVRDARAETRGRPLPRLEGRLQGLEHLVSGEEIHCHEPPPVPATPGRTDLLALLTPPPREESTPATWERVGLEIDWLLHPVLLCSLERAHVVLRPEPGGTAFHIDRGVWAGIPVTGQGRHRPGPEERLSLDLRLGPPWEPVGPYATNGPWARGRFETRLRSIGDLRVDEARGSFRIEGTDFILDDAAIGLTAGGRVEGKLTVDLSRRPEDDGGLPYRVDLQLPPADIAVLGGAAGFVQGAVTGTIVGAGRLEGQLGRDLPWLADAEGILSLHAREGEILRRLPAVLAIAAASEGGWFEPRETIPYEGMDLVLHIGDGRARAEPLAIAGPGARLMASGGIGVMEPYALEAVVGVFLFRGLDDMIRRVPLLKRVLGSDQNLVSAWFALEGPWNQPGARLIPMRSLSAGPVNFVLEGLPAFVRGSLDRVLGVLGVGRQPSPRALPAEPESPVAPGPGPGESGSRGPDRSRWQG